MMMASAAQGGYIVVHDDAGVWFVWFWCVVVYRDAAHGFGMLGAGRWCGAVGRVRLLRAGQWRQWSGFGWRF